MIRPRARPLSISGSYPLDPALPGPGRWSASLRLGLERELVLVDRKRLALLLERAAALRVEALGAAIPFPIEAGEQESWRAEARRTLARVPPRASLRVPRRALSRLVGAPPARWPAPAWIVERALEASDGELGRVCQAWTWILAGEIARAERLLQRLLRGHALLQHPWRVLEALAYAHAELGRWRLAFATLEAAAEAPACGFAVDVEALHVALRVGARSLVVRAAARLDLLAGPESAELEQALALLTRRLGRVERGALSPGDCRHVLEGLLAAGGSPSGRVARAVLEHERGPA